VRVALPNDETIRQWRELAAQRKAEANWVVGVRKTTMTPQWWRDLEVSNRRVLWIAIASLAIGVAPILANILSDAVASWLGCYIAEFSIYDRRGTFGDFSDDVSGCHGVGALLVMAHTFVFAFIFTWPLLLLSLFFSMVLLVRLLKRLATATRD